MNAKKTLSMTLAAAMAAGLLAGCGKQNEQQHGYADGGEDYPGFHFFIPPKRRSRR